MRGAFSKNTDDGMKTGNRKQRIGERAYGVQANGSAFTKKLFSYSCVYVV